MMTDYSAEPRTYPDGHVCNAWCMPERGEHCAICYGNPDYRAELLAYGLEEAVRLYQKGRTFRRCDLYPEAPPSVGVDLAHRGKRVYPGHEDAYRYWFTYPAHVEAAVVLC